MKYCYNLLFFMLMIIAVSNLSAAVYQCKVNGKLTFQDKPCVKGEGKQIHLKSEKKEAAHHVGSFLEKVTEFTQQKALNKLMQLYKDDADILIYSDPTCTVLQQKRRPQLTDELKVSSALTEILDIIRTDLTEMREGDKIRVNFKETIIARKLGEKVKIESFKRLLLDTSTPSLRIAKDETCIVGENPM
ncbi:DUF4124 domain-containing protein [Endozoicomonas sp. SM1973]|uniref:DUF4124 domain-containing protein n=1 Tax=Spartinivicinus marinus TaxID=2994442 RepID=A0A853I7I1_9GAMM|nr:DUF4124 domain-containing protein [Spartinivicinus marinus]MCX4027234.1 hypothetical protein [Spartinivicinus marinus]NYZ66044.1 DUF4124 domain-containing protein [Spartinivicinus marinus]